MGSSQSVFSEAELQDYQDLTYFTKKEILHVYKRFRQLDPKTVDRDPRKAKIELDTILELPELKMNPFKERIAMVFSGDGDGRMTFEDFLDMLSVFSDGAPRDLKAQYAFKIYDFDNDDEISKEDLQRVVDHLTGPEMKLNPVKRDRLVDEIMKEADLDHDSVISFSEFSHVISKAPEFESAFRIRL